MFEVRLIDAPKGCANCASCGCHGNDMKILQAFQTMTVDGRKYKTTSHVSILYLCKDCREELRKLLGDAPEEENDEKQSS